MSEITITTSGNAAAPKIDIVFFHGLKGCPSGTWSNSAGEYWPDWVCEDFPSVRVLSVGYPTNIFAAGAQNSMSFIEQVGAVLEMLLVHGVGERPIVFIAHSLGGLVVKQLLSLSSTSSEEEKCAVSQKARMVVFLATPHKGAFLAEALSSIGIGKKSKEIEILSNKTGFLDNLSSLYNGVREKNRDLRTITYYETEKTKARVTVVPKEMADPGLPDCDPVAISKDHFEICKPEDKDDLVYLGIVHRLRRLLRDIPAIETHSSTSGEDYAERSSSDRRELLEKLIDGGREKEYTRQNELQSSFFRKYLATGLSDSQKSDYDELLEETKQRFLSHVYFPLVCGDADKASIQDALQTKVVDPLCEKTFGKSKFSALVVLEATAFLAERCYISWD